MSKRQAVVILLCGALYLLGNARVQLWDRDEPRYAQASRQMLQSGDWVVPQLLDQPRINKPPLVYWCQAACMAVLGDNAFAARLPSVIAMLLTLGLLAVAVTRLADEERGFWTVLVFGTSGLVVMAAKMCLTDAVLLLFVTISQLCLYWMWRHGPGWHAVMWFGAATGFGMLAKGPVVLGVNATTVAVLLLLRWWDAWRDRRRARLEFQPPPRGFEVVQSGAPLTRDPQGNVPPSVSDVSAPNSPAAPLDYSSKPPARRRPGIVIKSLVALAIAAAIFAPWVVAMQMRLPGGLARTLQHDVVNRMTTPLEQHKGPPGYYLLASLGTFFPWVLLLVPAAKFAWRHRRLALVRFSLAAVAGPWVMFELVRTKLPHYVLPCFPFLAFLTADLVVRALRGRAVSEAEAASDPERARDAAVAADLSRPGLQVAVGIWAAAVILLGAAPWLALLRRFGFDRVPYTGTVLVTLAALACAVAVLRQFRKQRWERGFLAIGGTVFVLFGVLFAWYLPAARYLHLSEEVGGYLQEIGATEKGQVVMIDYKEDTLPFYQGGTIRPEPKNAYLAETPPERWPRYVVLTRAIWEKTPPEARARAEVLRTFRGWAYADQGRIVDVMVIRKRGSGQ